MADKPDNQPDEHSAPADPQDAVPGKAKRGTRKGRPAARAATASASVRSGGTPSCSSRWGSA